MIMHRPIPVVMYHSVGVPDKRWIWHHLTCPYKTFESHLKWLKLSGYKTIFLDEFYDYKLCQVEILKNSIVLTFDDGYLDNWVFAYPLLKKYGLKGTIFVNLDCLDPRLGVRKNFEDVWNGNCSIDDLVSDGFLSWDELKIMQDSGSMDIQSHTMSHDWYFSDSAIVDFHHPGDEYAWLAWNEKPERRHLYISEDQSQFVPYGYPVYEYGRALGVRRYFEDQALSAELAEFVAENGGPKFFEHDNWRDRLFKVANEYKKTHILKDRFETDAELEERVYYEIAGSKEILEKKLNKSVDFLCWPGGAFTNQCVTLAKKVGYKAVTLPSRLKNNPKQNDPFWIKRTGAAYRFIWKGRFICYTDPKYFLNSVKLASGEKSSIWPLRLHKLKYLFCDRFRIKCNQF